ncbi:hypothetical protein [Bacteroides sp. 224]|uniref:hypothetical protein n=1 Tax=Bacteroides sp. 224 TaxID=2302936 RepID=UPI0013D58515|nr:hypothetical protein [Bacteroides sp. 224]NDV67209.1 hypothetical protein [Bacteroides sp. 224]
MSSSKILNHIDFIGFENGNVIIENRITDERRAFNAGGHRVYDIYEEGNSLWVSIRDEGLRRFNIENNVVKLEKEYKIKKKTDTENSIVTSDYAVYNITEHEGDLYLSTSFGLHFLKKDNRNDSILSPFLPESISKNHYPVHQTLICGDSVYCATQKGLMVISKDDKKKYLRKCEGEEILYLHHQKGDSLLYASSSNCRHLLNIKTGKIEKTFCYNKNNLFAYITDSFNNEWEIFSDRIIHKGSQRKLFFDEAVLGKEYKNFIHIKEDCILLACGNKLYTFSKYQNLVGDSYNAIICHKIGDYTYFITKDGRLHKVKFGERKSEYLGKLSNIDFNEKIIGITASNEYLWMITKNKLYKIDYKKAKAQRINWVKESNLTNELLDFKHILHVEDTLLIGSRHYLYKIEKGNQDNTLNFTKIHAINHINSADLYVTNITQNKGERAYVATLNKGLFWRNGDFLQPIKNSGKEEIGSIRQMITYNDDPKKLILYSNKGLFQKDSVDFISPIHLYGERNDPGFFTKSVKTIRNNGTGSFLVGYKGIGYLQHTEDFIFMTPSFSHTYLTFNDNAIETEENNLIIGSPNGMYRYKSNNEIENIDITPPKKYWIEGIGSFIVLCIIGGGLYYYWRWRKKKELLARLIEFEAAKKAEKEKEEILKAERNEINEALNEISKLFYENNHDENHDEIISKCYLLWNSKKEITEELHFNKTEQCVALLYAACPNIKPKDISNFVIINGKQISDVKREVNRKIRKYKNYSYLMEIIYKQTLSTRINASNSQPTTPVDQ